ncbi:hypothetical protein ACFXTH_016034 [Malus domestica]
MDDWEKELEDTEDIALAHEVDRYLLDTVEKAQHGSQFDVLKWWKLKGRSTYPTLALIAKDVLPIQVSTVASESAFSGGKRLIHPCRSCLLPQTVECLRNWIKSEPIGIEYEASCAELEFYQECEEGPVPIFIIEVPGPARPVSFNSGSGPVPSKMGPARPGPCPALIRVTYHLRGT